MLIFDKNSFLLLHLFKFQQHITQPFDREKSSDGFQAWHRAPSDSAYPVKLWAVRKRRITQRRLLWIFHADKPYFLNKFDEFSFSPYYPKSETISRKFHSKSLWTCDFIISYLLQHSLSDFAISLPYFLLFFATTFLIE